MNRFLLGWGALMAADLAVWAGIAYAAHRAVS